MAEDDPSRAAPVRAVLAALAHGRPVARDAVARAFDVVMQGDATQVQIAALLTGLRVRGETAEVLAGIAESLRRAMVPLDLPAPDEVVDTCGTGGGSVPTFNISTAAAIVAAGCGVRIAKHGNRSFTSRSGSADVLEALGVHIEVDPPAMRRAFDEAGIVFMFAPRMHPAMRHVGPVRRELGIPTAMNIVGPLANPARAGRQVIGVADAGRLDTIAAALHALGTVHSLVVHGEPGLDEISPIGETRVIELREGRVAEWTVRPEELGYAGIDVADLVGGDPVESARIVEGCVRGEAPRGAIAAVVLNAGAAIFVAGGAESYAAAVERAADGIRDGGAFAALQRLRAALAR